MQSYAIKERLGRGTFSNVHRAVVVQTNEVRAIKLWKNAAELTGQASHEDDEARREEASLKKIAEHPHPNVIKAFEIFTWDPLCLL